MPTLADNVQNLVNRADALLNAFTAGLADFKAKADASLAANKQVVSDAIPTERAWVVDPVNGKDTNDGRSLATALKTLHAVVIQAAPSTKHIVYLVGDINYDHYSGSYADIRIRGSTSVSANDGFMLGSTKRRITFRPEAINSPLFPGYRVTSGIGLGSNIGTFNIDLVMADVPDGLSETTHFRCSGGSVSIDSGDIFATTPSNAGRLFSSVSTIPAGIWISGAIASAARGRLFAGVAAGADPNAGKRYNSNLTSN